MKDLVRDYLEKRISRRTLIKGLGALGLASTASDSIAESLDPVPSSAPAAAAATRSVQGAGGKLFVEQLKAAGVEFIFFNPSTSDAPIYNALVDEPSITLIKGLQEGAVVAMADGYARMSGRIGVALVANIGLPNALTQVVNAYKDGIPILLGMAETDGDVQARGGVQEYDHQASMPIPMTKWAWKANSAEGIPEMTRRAIKFARTPLSGPVFLSLSDRALRTEASANIIDAAGFDTPARIRPAATEVEAVARMLIEARNPLLTVGDEITLCQGEREVRRLAELLGLPVMGQATYGQWSTPFPTRSPLFLGMMQRNVPALGEIDFHLNIGSRDGEQVAPGARMASIRIDAASLARAGGPVDLAILADPKLAAADLIDAVGSMATASQLSSIASERAARVSAYTRDARRALTTLANEYASGSPIKLTRLGLELEAFLEPQTIYVADVDSGRNMDVLMSFGGEDKTYIGNGPSALGWGMAAAMGVKLAQPDRPVVAVVGDGSYFFSGPQPLWSIARYEAPITVIVLNNRSYNNERNRIWSFVGGAQLRNERDMTCYNGNPNVDIAKSAQAFGVDAEFVSKPDEIQRALKRSKRANGEGRPYLIEVLIERNGIGGASEWHPPFSIASLRSRRV
jgi:acetolactate synthase I/II/III large subunit